MEKGRVSKRRFDKVDDDMIPPPPVVVGLVDPHREMPLEWSERSRLLLFLSEGETIRVVRDHPGYDFGVGDSNGSAIAQDTEQEFFVRKLFCGLLALSTISDT